jgi:hypothetical protein
MATRSTIAIKQGDKVTAIYCHWDGYPEGVGATLANYYNSKGDAQALINLGGFSSLQDTLKETAEGAYGNETDRARTFDSVGDWLRDFNSGEEFYYLYTEGEGWSYTDGEDGRFFQLKTQREDVA